MSHKEIVITSKDVPELASMLNKSAIEMPLVAVFCGARLGNNPVYKQAATDLGRAMTANGFGLVYGGASIGLMGTVADAVLEQGESNKNDAVAIGVLPTFIRDFEVDHEGLTKKHVTDSMHTRKTIMAEYADAFVTLPGGVGTLDEIMEIATWRQLQRHTKPTIILNINGYYNPLMAHIKHSVEEGFISESVLDELIVCDDVASAMKILTTTLK